MAAKPSDAVHVAMAVHGGAQPGGLVRIHPLPAAVADFADLVPEQAITEAFATATAIVALQPKSQTNTSSIAGQIPGMLASMGSSRVLPLRPVPPM